MDGIILLNKSKGFTSRDICNKVGRILGCKKVGHNGTLDPFAEGLMIIALGKACKALPYIYEDRKTYIAELKLGVKTDSGDLTGNIIDTQKIHDISLELVKQKVDELKGVESQIPPMTSAISVDGVRLYKLAHQNIEIERKPRPIKVYTSKLISYIDGIITFEVEVSKGTYVRTLGETLAESLGNVGHLISLKRTAIGPISINDAISLDNVCLSSIQEETKYISLPKIDIDEKTYNDVIYGRKINLNNINFDSVCLVKNSIAIAICSKQDNKYYKIIRGLF